MHRISTPIYPFDLSVVSIGSSPPLAYCIILSQCPVRSLIYIFAYVFVPVTVCTCVRIGCEPQLHCRSLLRHRQPSFPACWPVFTCLLLYDVWREVTWPPLCSNWDAISRHFSSQTLLNKDRQCCKSLREAELDVHAVCAVRYDGRRPWVDLLCCSPHYDTAEICLTNDTLTTFSSSSDCYDASSLFRRCRLLCSCYNASAAQRLLLAASYIFWDIFGFILCYILLFPLLYLLVFP